MAYLAQTEIGRVLYKQGYGRYERNEIYAIGAADLDAIAVMIAEQAYAVSDAPTSFDASLYGVLANILAPPVETELKRRARRHLELGAYVERMKSALSKARGR